MFLFPFLFVWVAGGEQPSQPFLVFGPFGIPQGSRRCTIFLQLRFGGGDYLCRRAAGAKSQWNVIGYRPTNFSWHRLLLRLIPLQCRLPGWKYCRLFYGLTLLVGISHISAWMVHFCSVSQNRNSSPARRKEFLGGSSLFELEVVPELSLNRAVPRWKMESQ